MKFFNTFPKSFGEAVSNILKNTGSLLTTCATLYWMAQPAEAHGSCFGGKYSCTCSESCDEKAICGSYQDMGHLLIQAGYKIFNQTMMSHGTPAEQTALFQEEWATRSEDIFTSLKPQTCEALSITPSILSSVIPVALTLALCGKVLLAYLEDNHSETPEKLM